MVLSLEKTARDSVVELASGRYRFKEEDEFDSDERITTQTTAFGILFLSLLPHEHASLFVREIRGSLEYLLDCVDRENGWISWPVTAFVLYTTLGAIESGSLSRDIQLQRRFLRVCSQLSSKALRQTHVPNQEAISGLSLLKLARLVSDDVLARQALKKVRRVAELQGRDGTWAERWGPSLTYHAVTTAAIMETHCESRDLELLPSVAKALAALHQVTAPSGNFAYAGRSSQFAFAYAAAIFGERLALNARQNVCKHCLSGHVRFLYGNFFDQDGFHKNLAKETVIKTYGGTNVYAFWTGAWLARVLSFGTTDGKDEASSASSGPDTRYLDHSGLLVVKCPNYTFCLMLPGYTNFGNYIPAGQVCLIEVDGVRVADSPCSGEAAADLRLASEVGEPEAAIDSPYSLVRFENGRSVTYGRAGHRTLFLRHVIFRPGSIVYQDSIRNLSGHRRELVVRQPLLSGLQTVEVERGYRVILSEGRGLIFRTTGSPYVSAGASATQAGRQRAIGYRIPLTPWRQVSVVTETILDGSQAPPLGEAVAWQSSFLRLLWKQGVGSGLRVASDVLAMISRR